MTKNPDLPAQQAPGKTALSPLEAWLAELAKRGEIGALLEPAFDEQCAQGYGHTLREICQQPVTWPETAAHMAAAAETLAGALADCRIDRREGALVLTGSGSSLYAAESLAIPLQEALGVPVFTVPAGVVLTHAAGALPPSGPFLLVSLARSGNSPESRAVVDLLLETLPRARHLLITCNRDGALATGYRGEASVRTLVLDEKTNDRSLVMTSSFTNMVLAGQALAALDDLGPYAHRTDRLADAGRRILIDSADRLAATAREGLRSAVYLGSGPGFAVAREAALKMVEMTDGRVWTLPESYLGLRHGPMSALDDRTLVVAFLSSDRVTRAYELDLLRELERKRLGARRVVVGDAVPAEAAPGPNDLVVDTGGEGLGDADLLFLDVVVGQLLAFFRCRHEGLRPDAPSEKGVISRVVDTFEIHRDSPPVGS
jgi:D-galactosamine 6-phosphate deaminase/isomerase